MRSTRETAEIALAVGIAVGAALSLGTIAVWSEGVPPCGQGPTIGGPPLDLAVVASRADSGSNHWYNGTFALEWPVAAPLRDVQFWIQAPNGTGPSPPEFYRVIFDFGTDSGPDTAAYSVSTLNGHSWAGDYGAQLPLEGSFDLFANPSPVGGDTFVIQARGTASPGCPAPETTTSVAL